MSGYRCNRDAIMRQNFGTGETARANVKRDRAMPRRLLSLLAACGVFLSCATSQASGPAAEALDLDGTSLELLSQPAPNGHDAPDLGALTWLATLELRSPDRRFGGLSGLLVSPDGAEAITVSDKGYRVQFGLRHDARGRLSGVTGGRIAPLLGQDGRPMEDERDRDAEALARLPEHAMAIGFEGNDRLWLYPAGSAAPLAGIPRPLDFPSARNNLGRNSGLEAITELPDGELLAIAEGRDDASESLAFLWRGGRWHGMTYRRDVGFRATGAALLPGGDVLVVERFFTILTGVKIRLVRLRAGSLQPGASLGGEVLATLTPPVALDNMEGIDVRRSVNGETLIYLISDDNYNPLQRTLLLQFALEN